MSPINQHEAIKERCKSSVLSNCTLQEFMRKMNMEIDKGLKKETNPQSTMKCYPTYVQNLPDNTVRGKFLALDLGGTNFRVLLVHFEDSDDSMESETFNISQDIMTGPGEQLFDYIVECLDVFTKKMGVPTEILPLGFTFSFPFQQNSLTHGVLMKWTKGFDCEGVVGQNVVELLEKALLRRKVKVKVTAILNDTTGCLMSCAWKNTNCKIGIIVGTGCNACYVEKSKNVTTFENESGEPEIIINLEWGAFGDDGALDFIRTEFDKEAECISMVNKGNQTFEKMVSGMYLGEIARIMMDTFRREGILFNGKGSVHLSTPGSFLTSMISEIEAEKKGEHKVCCSILTEKLGLAHATEEDVLEVQYICKVISQRSAYLVSAATACLINRMDYDSLTVGVDGSVYRYHPHYHDLMVEKICELITRNVSFDLMLSEDGSGRGAAIVAAAAAATNKKQDKKDCDEGPESQEDKCYYTCECVCYNKRD